MSIPKRRVTGVTERLPLNSDSKLCATFEEVIQTLAAAGFALESWKFNTTLHAGTLCHSLVGVFVEERGQA